VGKLLYKERGSISMRNRMFKIISCLVGVLLLLFAADALLAKVVAKKAIVVMGKIFDVAIGVCLVALVLSTIMAAILSVKECIAKEGRQYVDKFLLKVVCIFVLLFFFRSNETDYIKGILYPALIWIVVPRAYDYITSNEQ
jgi:succinate dehydrogenase hydrophobic anchor subunit